MTSARLLPISDVCVCVCVCVCAISVPQNIWSVSVDGKIKQWTYGKCRAIAEYDAPGFCLTTMSFSADGARLVYWNYCSVRALGPVRLTHCCPIV